MAQLLGKTIQSKKEYNQDINGLSQLVSSFCQEPINPLGITNSLLGINWPSELTHLASEWTNHALDLFLTEDNELKNSIIISTLADGTDQQLIKTGTLMARAVWEINTNRPENHYFALNEIHRATTSLDKSQASVELLVRAHKTLSNITSLILSKHPLRSL